MTRVVHSCCSAAGVFLVLSDGSMWWRRHNWLSEKWQFVAPPPRAIVRLRRKPAAPRHRSGIKTGVSRRAPRR